MKFEEKTNKLNITNITIKYVIRFFLTKIILNIYYYCYYLIPISRLPNKLLKVFEYDKIRIRPDYINGSISKEPK